MLALAADSVTAAGHRLCTVVATGESRIAIHAPVAFTTTGDTTVATGHPHALGAVFGPARIAALCTRPRLIGGRRGLHAPFLTDHEHTTGDLAWRAVLAVSRAAGGGGAAAPAIEAARYLWLLAAADLAPMDHAALPAPTGAGRFPGWVTWAEIITPPARGAH